MYVSIIDYGTGNLKSVYQSLEVASSQLNNKIKINISNNPKDILNSDKIILPGQGSYAQCIKNIKSINGLWDAINEFVITKRKPIFGICVGMQLFSDYGFEEQKTEGFGWINGSVKKIILKDKNLKLPHIGWNNINIIKESCLFEKIKNLSHYYFVHSYVFDVTNKNYVIATVDYDSTLVAAVLKENIFGTQFHPEKSQEDGIRLIYNFLNCSY
jgi:glutamine amidotransferase